ncbi:MAG TPA: hypothetical protein VJ179_03250 [Patescibacteria group bacterium]|nr:hypothetical protein [Patescibacteria group bacterium]
MRTEFYISRKKTVQERVSLFLRFHANKRKRKIFGALFRRATIHLLAFLVTATVVLGKQAARLWEQLLARILHEDKERSWVFVYRISLSEEEKGYSLVRKERLLSFLAQKLFQFSQTVKRQSLFRTLSSKAR